MARESSATKIKRLQHELNMCNSSLETLYKVNQTLVAQAEQDFLNSPTFQQMTDRISFLESIVTMDKFHIQSLKADARKIDDKTRQIYEDNRKLVENKDNLEYFIGITENYHDAEEYNALKTKLLNEQGKVDGLKLVLADLEKEIARLQGEIAKFESDKSSKPDTVHNGNGKGRPIEVSDKDRQKILELRAEGQTIRAIASQVHYSVGTVHRILNNK